MGKAKPLKIGTREFSRQKDALDFFKAMLNRYKIGAIISSDDSVDLLNLLGLHQDCSQKTGVGIKHFNPMVALEGTKCFGITRNDGSLVDFSYQRCVTQRW
jgi:hypothetical protein